MTTYTTLPTRLLQRPVTSNTGADFKSHSVNISLLSNPKLSGTLSQKQVSKHTNYQPVKASLLLKLFCSTATYQIPPGTFYSLSETSASPLKNRQLGVLV